MHVSHFSSAEARLKTLESFSTTDSDRWVQTVKSAETNSGAAGQTPMNTRLRTHTPRKHTLKSKKDMRGLSSLLTWKTFRWRLVSGSLSGHPGVLELGSGSSYSKSDATGSLKICALAKTFAVLESRWKDAPGPNPTPDGSIPSFSAVHSHKQRKI